MKPADSHEAFLASLPAPQREAMVKHGSDACETALGAAERGLSASESLAILPTGCSPSEVTHMIRAALAMRKSDKMRALARIIAPT